MVGVAAQEVGASGEATSHQLCVYRRHVVVEASEHREEVRSLRLGKPRPTVSCHVQLDVLRLTMLLCLRVTVVG